MEWIGLFILIIIAVGVYGNSKNEEIEKTINERLEFYLNYKKGISYTKEYINNKFTNAILLDEKEERVAFLVNELKDIYLFDYEDITGVEIIKDGETISKTDRSSQLVGAVVGGFLAGNTGALIGGLSGNVKQEEKVHAIDLKVTLDSFSTPSLSIKFYEDKEVSEIKHYKYFDDLETSLKELERWYDILNLVIRRSVNNKNQELTDVSTTTVEENNHSLNNRNSRSLEQLDKLVGLYKEGFLTQEEYEFEKKKIINAESNNQNI